MSFNSDFLAMMRRAADREDEFVRAQALALGAAIVEASPVDTGRFRGNWQYGAGAINETVNSTGDGAIGRIILGLATFARGNKIYITNSLPYARRLEYDAWSQKAPAGMVRISVLNWKAHISAQAAAL